MTVMTAYGVIGWKRVNSTPSHACLHIGLSSSDVSDISCSAWRNQQVERRL